MPEAHPLRVSAADAGCRLDAVLARRLALKRHYVQRLLKRQLVTLRGRPAQKGWLLSEGDELFVRAFRHPSEGILSDPVPELRILARSDGLVAVDKPAGIATHPLDYDERGTLANRIAARFPEARSVGYGGLEPGLLHRLDTQTSGIVVFALTEADWRAARRALSERAAQKIYLARVHGQLRGAHDLRIQLAHRGARMKVVERGGLEAHTVLRSLDVRAQDSRVEIDLRTGVRHQIRATLASLGHPIVGDRLYGSAAPGPRHLLHAWKICIGAFSAVSEPPADLD